MRCVSLTSESWRLTSRHSSDSIMIFDEMTKARNRCGYQYLEKGGKYLSLFHHPIYSDRRMRTVYPIPAPRRRDRMLERRKIDRTSLEKNPRRVTHWRRDNFFCWVDCSNRVLQSVAFTCDMPFPSDWIDQSHNQSLLILRLRSNRSSRFNIIDSRIEMDPASARGEHGEMGLMLLDPISPSRLDSRWASSNSFSICLRPTFFTSARDVVTGVWWELILQMLFVSDDMSTQELSVLKGVDVILIDGRSLSQVCLHPRNQWQSNPNKKNVNIILLLMLFTKGRCQLQNWVREWIKAAKLLLVVIFDGDCCVVVVNLTPSFHSLQFVIDVSCLWWPSLHRMRMSRWWRNGRIHNNGW